MQHHEDVSATSPGRPAWNKGKLVDAKPPLRPKHVWSIRTKLQVEGRIRELAMFNLAIDSKLRGCDVVALKVEDIAPNGYAIDRATVRQKKTGQPVKFELTEQTRQAVDDYLRTARKKPGQFLFAGRSSSGLTTRQYARLVSKWIAGIGLDANRFGTHSLRRTKATLIYRRTGNLRAVQLLRRRLARVRMQRAVIRHSCRGNIMSLRATPRLTCLKTLCWLLPAIVLAGGAWAQPGNYPDKPVRIISDAAPGGAIDTNLRIIAEGLSKEWAQQVVIENRPGAGGAISATAAAEAPPDGYTIYAPALSVFLTIPGKAPNLPLELPRDFTAIGITAVQPQSIGINPKLGINSLPELIALAKKLPGSISYAVTGVGRLTHLTGELLQIRGNFKLQMVPYTGGSAQALADVTAGRVTLVIEGYAGLAGAYESGQLKALAVASEKRLPHLPDLPTVAETLPGFVAAGWQCVVAPVGTPDVIVRKISDDLRAVLIKPEIKDKLAARGAYVHPTTPTEAQAFVRSQQELWKPALEQVALQFKEK